MRATVDLKPEIKQRRNCDNCFYKTNSGTFGIPTCSLSGWYCTVERSYPDSCGKNYENWLPKEKPSGIRGWLIKLLS